MTRFSYRAIVLFLFAAARVPSAALADKPAVPPEVKRHYDEGTKAYNLGEFARAVEEYRAAYHAKPDPAYLYNIAQAYRLSGDLNQALFFYRSFLNSMPDTPNRHDVERRIHELDAQLQRQKVVTTAPPNGAVAPGTLIPGSETPPVEARPAAPAERLAAPKPAATETETSVSIVAPAPKPAPTRLYKKWWLWTAVGAVAAGVAVGVTLGVTANQSSSAPGSHFGSTGVF